MAEDQHSTDVLRGKFFSIMGDAPLAGDACAFWRGRLMSRGYGVIPMPYGRQVLAHRASYELHKGPIPSGLYVCHSCDNTKCVNPAHLFVGDQYANMRDCWAKGRGHLVGGAQGEQHPCARTTWAVVRAIRADYSPRGRVPGTLSCAALSRKYGLSYTLVYEIVRGRSWRDVSYTRGRGRLVA